MKKTEKKRTTYSLRSNYGYILSNMWSFSKSLIWYGIAEMLFNALTPFGMVLIPTIVVGLLMKKVPIEIFLITLAAVFIIYGVVAGIQAFLVSRNRMQYIEIRFNKFWMILHAKCLQIDYMLLEKENVREDLEKAMGSIYTNQRGIEGFMHRNVSLGSNILGLILYACIISTVHPIILVLLLLISVLQMLSFHGAKKYEHKKRDEMSKISVTQSYLQEQAFDLKAGKDIRLYQLNKIISKVYQRANKEMMQLISKTQSKYYLNDVVGIILRFLRDAICYGYLIYLLTRGLEVSYFVLYLGVVGGFATWFTKITEDVAEIGRNHLMICDYRSFLEKENVFQHKDGIELKDQDMALDIIFDHVSFGYEGAKDFVLKDISFHIKKGEKLALVGINGAGKTTLVKLMCGFYQPTEGRILINGIDIKELNIEKYFSQIAVVFQDPLMLSFTIAENISGMAAKDIDREHVHKVMELSGLSGKVKSLAKGMDTYLNKDIEKDGIQLSGGEIQKLVLARALYKNAKLLILDEPTAALDAIAESEMYDKYQTLLDGRTSLFISHRLASTRFCDFIIFLENGKIIEEGSHETLMNRKGRYAEMFEVQSKYYKEEGTYEVEKILA